MQHIAALQHTATQCNTLQHTATHCNAMQHTSATHCSNTLQQHTAATHCKKTAALHCNTTRTLDVTHPYVWRDSSIYVTWLIHMCDVTHPYVWRDSSIYVTWLIHMHDMNHPYVCRDSTYFLSPWQCRQRQQAMSVSRLEYAPANMNEPYHTGKSVVSHVWKSRITTGMSHVTCLNELCRT